MIQTVADVTIAALVCTAAWWDFTTHRIPNWLTVSGLAVALLLRALVGFSSLALGLEGLGLALAVSLALYALRAIGGGDVKLLAAVGAFFGFPRAISALALMAVLGGAFALVSMVRRGLLPLLIFNTVDLVKSWRTLGRTGELRTLDSPGALTIPYGVPIAVGTLFCWFGEGVRL
ncbi:MAG: prepilin peptidase CpaA [Gemmatimonadales bacterium]|nr:prepilin peptidase CpaA [Gemmatimonadales bacterium]